MCGTMIAARTPTEHHRLTLFAASQHPCSPDRAYKSFGHTIRLDSCIVHACFFVLFPFASSLHTFPSSWWKKEKKRWEKNIPKNLHVCCKTRTMCLSGLVHLSASRTCVNFVSPREGPACKKKQCRPSSPLQARVQTKIPSPFATPNHNQHGTRGTARGDDGTERNALLCIAKTKKKTGEKKERQKEMKTESFTRTVSVASHLPPPPSPSNDHISPKPCARACARAYYKQSRRFVRV